jgi:hypothetical protein
MVTYILSRLFGKSRSAYAARQERRATTSKPWLHRVRTVSWWTKRVMLTLIVLVLGLFLLGQVGAALHFPWLALGALYLAFRSWRRYPRKHVKPVLVSAVEDGHGPPQAEVREESQTVPAYVTRLPDGTIQIFPWQGQAPR